MNGPAIILGAVCIVEAAFICILLYVLTTIMEAVKDHETPVEPIEFDAWEDDEDD